MKQEVTPLHIFVTETAYWCTNNIESVPLMSATYPIHTTKERVQFFLDNPWEIEKSYWPILLMLRIKYNQRVLHIMESYELPDINGSECSVD